MSDGQWYYCLTHHAVEPFDGCKSEDRLGPYATQEDAAHALEKVRERNKEWDEEDSRFEDDAEDRDGEDLSPFKP